MQNVVLNRMEDRFHLFHGSVDAVSGSFNLILIGHFIMHESFYDGLSFDTQQEYINFLQTTIPQKDL